MAQGIFPNFRPSKWVPASAQGQVGWLAEGVPAEPVKQEAATAAYKAVVQRAGRCSDLVAASILDGSFTDTEMKTNTYLERNSREM